MSDEAAREIEGRLLSLIARAKTPGLGTAEFEEMLVAELIAVHGILLERRSQLARAVQADPAPPNTSDGSSESDVE